MKFTILIREEIEIPDDKLPELYDNFLERFYGDTPNDGRVYDYDLIQQAVLEGLIDEPGDDWFVESGDDIWRAEDIAEYRKPAKKTTKRGKKK